MQLDWFTALVLGIVEGLTEFLPVSSTGHLILSGSLLGYQGEQSVAVEIVIQGAAILAVCWEYRRMLTHTALTFVHEPKSRAFLLNLVLGFLPMAVLGLAFQDVIKQYLFHPLPVATGSGWNRYCLMTSWKASPSTAIGRKPSTRFSRKARDFGSCTKVSAVCVSMRRYSQHTARIAAPWITISTATDCSPW